MYYEVNWTENFRNVSKVEKKGLIEEKTRGKTYC